MHEDFSRHHDVKMSSNRSFGLVVATAFGALALAPLRHQLPVRGWALGLSGTFAVLAVAAPGILEPLNIAWTRFGLVLHRLISPLIMAVVFYTAVLPTGLLMRAFGRDPLRRKRDPAATSYWIPRVPPGPSPESMTQQF